MVFGLEALPPELMSIALTTIVSMAVAVLSTVFLFIILFLTKGVTIPYLKARMRGKAVLLNFRKDKQISIESVENEAGMYKSKIGQHMINPDSIYIAPNKVPTSIGYEAAGSILNPKHILFIQKILKEGVTIDVPKYVPKLKDGKPIMRKDGKILMEVALDAEKKPIIEKKTLKAENIEELEALNEDFHDATGEWLVLNYGGETLRVQDIMNFFLYDNNPSLIAAKIENKMAKEREDERKFPMKALVLIAPIIISLVIAFMLITQYMSSQSYQSQWAACVAQLANYQSGARVITTTTTVPSNVPTSFT